MEPLEAYHMALDLVKKAGFELANASLQSETCYYTHPSRKPLLLRISMHSSSRSPMGLRSNTLASVVISPHDRGLAKPESCEMHVKNMVAIGIGRYFLGDPKPSKYYGKKGTWEHSALPA